MIRQLHQPQSCPGYPISNSIGVGILSYNRRPALERLVDSITRTTDLSRTTIFISDDGSTDANLLRYLDKLRIGGLFVVLMNSQQLGVAGNTNRLLRCLSRFQFKLLLNDDTQVLKPGWDDFYFRHFGATGIHHFCMRQPGVYGAQQGERITIGGVGLTRVIDKPHGAVLALDQLAFASVGYFNEAFGIYGCEHVDWSRRVGVSGLQPSGFYDITDSGLYFKIHSEPSALADRIKHFQAARQVVPCGGVRVEPTDRSEIRWLSYVAIANLDNIRALRFPGIQIVPTIAEASHHVVLSAQPILYGPQHAEHAYARLIMCGKPQAMYSTRQLDGVDIVDDSYTKPA